MGSNRFQHLQLGRLDGRNDLFALHGRKTVQKILDGFAAFEVVDEVLKWDARAEEHRRAAQNFRIGMDHAFQCFGFHVGKMTAIAPACPRYFSDPAR